MKTLNFKLISLTLLLNLFCATASFSETWNKIPSGTTKKLNTICFPSSQIGYIGGNDSVLLKSTDAGLSWSQLTFTGVNFLPGGEHILKLQFLNDSIGYMSVGPYSGSYKTVDGGQTWSALPLAGNHCYNQGLYFFDQSNGFVGGSGCFQSELISTLSTGVWSTQVLPSANSNPLNIIRDIQFLNTNFGLAASHSGYIFRTVNGGASWDSVAASVDLNPITSVLIVNDSLAYAGYESTNIGFGLYVSTNAGLSWSQDLNSATFYYPDFLALHQSKNGTIYTGGISQNQEGLIFSSTGNFSIWNYDVVEQQINALGSYSDSIVFAVGDSGYLVVNKNLSGLGIRNWKKNSDLFELYPNPARNSVNLLLLQAKPSKNSHITIFSSLGSILVHSEFVSQIDITNFAKGIYVVEFFDGEISHRKKLIVE